jgi:hypothetical protein
VALGMTPALEARPKAQLSKKQLRQRYVAGPIKIKHRKYPKAKWGKVKARKH